MWHPVKYGRAITDVSGYPRLSGAHVDTGAVEAQIAPANNRPVLKNVTRSSVNPSRSEEMMVAVGFIPRKRTKILARRVATGEN